MGQGLSLVPSNLPLHQLASPIDASKPMSPAEMAALTMADFGDTKAQTVSTLNKIKTILATHGYTLADVIKLTVFVAGDPARGGKMDFDGMNEGFKKFFGTADNLGAIDGSGVKSSRTLSCRR